MKYYEKVSQTGEIDGTLDWHSSREEALQNLRELQNDNPEEYDDWTVQEFDGDPMDLPSRKEFFADSLYANEVIPIDRIKK